MRLARLFAVRFLIFHGLLLAGAICAADPSLDTAAWRARSVVSLGETARLQRVMVRAQEGHAVTVAVIGGSITQGAKATRPEKRYGNLVADWWRQKFPKSHVEFVNAGIGATGSNYGALRAGRDLLSKKPDFVVVEYSVNDNDTQASAESLEGLVRQILAQPQQPAVMLFYMMRRGGSNSQAWHGKVGQHYALPAASFRDAIWPEIQAARIKWEDVVADEVHPNDRGHACCAGFITSLLDKTRQELPPQDRLPEIRPLPQPLLSDLFEHTTLCEADVLKPVVNNGWLYDPATKAWKSDKPGSTIEFEIEGQIVFSMHHVVKGPMGKARVHVDGQPVRELNGWFDQTWGGYRQTNEVARLQAPGKHHVRFELLADKNLGSTGHEFRILGLGTAGRTER